jgi:hypothetical protein
MDAILDTAPCVLQSLFGATADRLARQTGFVRRLRCLRPAALARTLSVFLIREPNASLAQLARELNISDSALSQRLNTPAASEFMHGLLCAALAQLTEVPAQRISIPLLRRFNGVYLVDGTTLSLPAALAEFYPGYGGGTHPGDPSAAAAAKVLLRWRLDTSQATELLCAAATTPDLHLLQRLPDLQPGALHIADLGFFDAEFLGELTTRGVFWLTRLPTVICVGADHADQELADWLANLDGQTDCWEGELSIGKVTPVRARVLVQRCPPEVAARRRQKLHDRARRKGRSVSQRQLTLCDWWVLATNVPADTLRAREATELYRARWQIELVFKRWKSLGRLNVPQHAEPHRALATLFGLLLGLLVVDWFALQRGGALSGRSLWQAWQVVRRWLDRILLALQNALDWAFVLNGLNDASARRARQAHRKRCPSTRQRLFRATIET